MTHFSTERTKAPSAFQRFVLAGINAEFPWKNLQQDIYLGDESFVAATQIKILETRRTDQEIPRPQRLAKASSLQELFSNHPTIADAVIAAYQSGRFTMRQIADHLGVRYSTVSRLCRTWMCQCCEHTAVQEQYSQCSKCWIGRVAVRIPVPGSTHRPRRTGLGALHHPAPSLGHRQSATQR